VISKMMVLLFAFSLTFTAVNANSSDSQKKLSSEAVFDKGCRPAKDNDCIKPVPDCHKDNHCDRPCPTGPKGDKGDHGSRGPRGKKGAIGERGPKGEKVRGVVKGQQDREVL
jgi:hypothetical protein